MKRRVLGKGLESIITNQPQPSKDSNFKEIDVCDVYPNPFQPRKQFNEEKIRELAASIQESGLIQPVSVYHQENRYFLIVGERRWRAAQFLKWKKIPAIIREMDVNDVMIGALVENIQREDLNALEVAQGIEILMEKNSYTQEKAAEKLGMSRTAVTNFLRLLKLPVAVKKSLAVNEITQGHARSLLGLKSESDINRAFSTVLNKRLSVRQTESLVKDFYKKIEKEEKPVDPDLIKTEEKLTRILATKVKLNYQKNGKGKIEIFFNRLDEFERIFDLLATKE